MWLGIVVSMALGNVRFGKGGEGDRITGKGGMLGVCFGAEVAKRWFKRVPERSACERPCFF